VQRLALLLALWPDVVHLLLQPRQVTVNPHWRPHRRQRPVGGDLDEALEAERGAQQDADVEHPAAGDGLRAAEQIHAAHGERVRRLVERGQQRPEHSGELRKGAGGRADDGAAGRGPGRRRGQLDAVLLREELDAEQLGGAEVVGERLEILRLRAVQAGVADAFPPRLERHRVDGVHVRDPGPS